MAPIYLDPSALLLPAGAAPHRGEDPRPESVEPGAHDAVRNLVEAGFEVILLGPEDAPAPPLPVPVGRASGLPDHLEAGSWYLTGDPHPAFGRPLGGTTVLVGPRRPDGRLPLPRFDLTARDLASAAMEILTRDAMA